MKNFLFKRTKSISAQIASLKSHYPNFKVSFLEHDGLMICGELQPTPRSDIYHFELSYKLKKKPKILIINPKLVKNFKNESIPHLYSDGSLCLYQPKYLEFTSKDYISETIIPWASLWLYYYELWHTTGEWLGGGEHPEVK